MILVLSDDLSGAAELAGIAFAHGLSAEVQTDFNERTDAEVICLDTNTRRLAPEDAVLTLQKLNRHLRVAQPDWIYKKTDSALRGNILVELQTLLGVTDRMRVIFVPANPSRGRVIRAGEYFVDDLPLHDTDFAHDPHHPATTANVAEHLGHDPAFTIPEAASAAGVTTAAQRCDDLVLPAGAGDFFAALLETRGHKPIPVKTPRLSGPALFICGSMAAWGRQRAAQCEAHGVPVCSMPPKLFGQSHHNAGLHAWVCKACTALDEHGSCMLAIGRVKAVENSPLLEARLAQAMAMVLAQVEVARLMLEGGTTASAALARLQWKQLRAMELAAPDLTGLRVDAVTTLVFMKPGSYDWPDSVWPTG